MQSEDVITAYNRAWNERKVDGLTDLLTPDCLHFDAYFGDLVPAWNMAEYLKNDLASAKIDYTVTDIIDCNAEVACYKYAARILDMDDNVVGSYNGAEKLCLSEGKIRRMTDWYVAPPELLSTYYGPGSLSADYAGNRGTSEFAIHEILQCRSKLIRAIRSEIGYAHPGVTLSSIAREIKHAEDLILLVLDIAFNTNFDKFVDKCRIDCAREMIIQQVLAGYSSTELSVDKRIASTVGFSSHASFVNAFRQRFDQSPRQCRHVLEKQQLVNLKAA